MENDQISLIAVGDLYFSRQEPATAFANFRQPLQEADITFGNLEAPCSSLGAPTIGKYITLRMDPHVIPALANTGFDLVALANNHAIDYGREAFVDTLDRLDRAGIARIGGGRDVHEARRAVVLERSGLRIGFIGYATTVPWGYEATQTQAGIAAIDVSTSYEPRYQIMSEQPGTPATVITRIASHDLDQLTDQIRSLRQRVDVLIVSLHWGVAFVPDPVSYQTELGRAAIDAGAHMVLGHHAHVMQGVEMYRGAPIFYSLSNFVFDRNNPKFGIETFLVHARLSRNGITRLSLLPAMLPLNGDPRPIMEEERHLFKAQMERLSRGMNSDFSWEDEQLVITTGQEKDGDG